MSVKPPGEEVSAAAFNAVMAALAEYGGDHRKLLLDLKKGQARQREAVKVKEVTGRDLVDLINNTVITKPEARKLLGLRGPGPTPPRTRRRTTI